MRSICFLQGISSDRTHTIVRSRNFNTFDEIAETALEKENAIYSKNEIYRKGTTFGRLVCSNCGKTGHLASKGYLKDKKNVRVDKVGSEARRSTTKFQGLRKGDIRHYNCGEVGHVARDSKKPGHAKKNTLLSGTGVQGRTPDRVNPSNGSMNTKGRKNGTTIEYVSVQSDVSNGNTLLLLVDTGADISLLKPGNLDMMMQFDREGRVKVRSVSGSTIETMGAVNVVVCEGSVRVPFIFQLTDKQIDLACDGILGSDFLVHAGAKISYETQILTLGAGSDKTHKCLSAIDARVNLRDSEASTTR